METMSLNTNAALNELYDLLSGVNNPSLSGNEALNLILEIIQENSSSKPLSLIGDVFYDDYITGANGLIIPTTSSIVGAGSNASYGAALRPNLNSSQNHNRTGLHVKAINTSTNPSRSSQYVSAASTVISSESQFYIEGSWSIPTGLINYTNNPVIQCFGVLPLTTFTANSMAVDGFYFRAPRVGETQFIKFVILQAGVETIINTPVVFTGSNYGIFKTAVYWNGTDLTWFIVDATGVHQGTITELLGTYTFTGAFTYGWHLATLGAQVGTVAHQIWYDSNRRWVGEYLDAIV